MKNVERRGGARKGTGPKKGSGRMTKICISVDSANWQTALSRWQDKGSRLVDRLVWRYIDSNGKILKPEAMI
ncbi:MAG TPA: hypothetical protein VH413_01650 [Verrucomicrobiae bacterium]|nr:hypothetical protein [Verrucomicrobiae bacterium]